MIGIKITVGGVGATYGQRGNVRKIRSFEM